MLGDMLRCTKEIEQRRCWRLADHEGECITFRPPAFEHKVFDGEFHVVDDIDGNAIESHRHLVNAEWACCVLNERNILNGHAARYHVEKRAFRPRV